MPTLSSRNNIPNPRNIDANKLMRSSLKITLSLGPVLPEAPLPGRLTSNTKNQAVKNVPMVNRTVDRSGNADGLIGETYRTIESISMINANGVQSIYRW